VLLLWKIGHTTISCKARASDLLKGKIKELANVAIVEDPPKIDSSDNPVKELGLFVF
jgi:hypothetical protein